MAFRELLAMWNSTWPKTTPERVKYLAALDRVRDGSIYDLLPYPFTTEFDGQEEYVEMVQRRPSVKYALAKIVVDETATLTFGEGHAPYVRIYNPFDPDAVKSDPKAKKLAQIIEFIRHVTSMDAVMFECIQKGSSGSVCAIIKITDKGKPWIRVVSGQFLTPTFSENDPNELILLEEIYKTTYSELIKHGYNPAELGQDPTQWIEPTAEYWMNIQLDKQKEQRMVPLKRSEIERLGKPKDGEPGKVYEWVPDAARTYPHTWGEVPALWGRNLHEREEVDGPSTYSDLIDNGIEIDYIMSQVGRGYKYTMDPITAVKQGDLDTRIPGGLYKGDEPGASGGVRTPARTLDVPPGGDAKLLEITGQGLSSAREWVKMLREYSLEVVSAMKSDQEHAGGAQSGRALELLYQALVMLVGRMHTDYGDGMMVPLILLLIRGVKKGIVKLWLLAPEDVPEEEYPLKLVWPVWWRPLGADFNQTAQALLTAAGGTAREGKQMMPMRMIFEAFAAAMGIPDPVQAADMAEAEFEKYRKEQMQVLLPKPAAPGGAS
jgi:hypothetical protein